MRTNMDLSPLFRSSIGFDRVFDLLESASRLNGIDNWPPYDIEKAGDDEYRITMAVAGFAQDELTVTHQPNLLVISGQKSGEDKGDYLHRGIAGRVFERRFELADHVEVAGARLENGLLSIDLRREVPEEMKPRRIQIGTPDGQQQLETQPLQVEAGKHAA
jgi:molecular chaperone IbpA